MKSFLFVFVSFMCVFCLFSSLCVMSVRFLSFPFSVPFLFIIVCYIHFRSDRSVMFLSFFFSIYIFLLCLFFLFVFLFFMCFSVYCGVVLSLFYRSFFNLFVLSFTQFLFFLSVFLFCSDHVCFFFMLFSSLFCSFHFCVFPRCSFLYLYLFRFCFYFLSVPFPSLFPALPFPSLTFSFSPFFSDRFCSFLFLNFFSRLFLSCSLFCDQDSNAPSSRTLL